MNHRAGMLISCLAAATFTLPASVLSASGESKKTTIKTRLGVEYDSNIFENTEQKTGGLAGRFYLESNSTLLRSETAVASLRYQGGVKGYLASVPHDSLSAPEPVINALNVDFRHKLAERIVVGFGGEIKSRILAGKGERHLPNQDGYLQGAARALLQFGLPGNLVGTITYQGSFAKFNDFQEFSSRTQEISVNMDRKFSRRLRCGLGGSWRRLSLERDYLNKQLQPGGKPQRDVLWEGRASFSLHRFFLIRGGYSWVRNHSNSYGYSFAAHRFTLLLGKMLSRRIGLQLYGILQLKRYTDDIQETPLVSAPAKELEGNVFVLKISGDVTDRCGIDLQYSLRRDESAQRNRFHTKNLYTSGLTISF